MRESSNLLDNINQMTQIAGENRLELLTFYLDGQQPYAVNVFKVREVMPMPPHVIVPRSDPCIVGLTDIRGEPISVIDLPRAMGLTPIDLENEQPVLLLMEFNLRTYGMLIRGVRRIYHMSWDMVTPPPDTLAQSHYLTAVIRHEGEIIHLLDLEKVMADILGLDLSASEEVVTDVRNRLHDLLDSHFVLVAEDSPSAQKVISKLLDELGLYYRIVPNGEEALKLLKKWAAKHKEDPSTPPVSERVLRLITDLERPVMDGYTLIRNVREDPDLRELFVVVNSSMSGDFNEDLTSKIGADAFLVKGQSDEMAELLAVRAEVTAAKRAAKEAAEKAAS